MNSIYTDIDLCAALSDIFVDNETNFLHIASIAQYFPIEHVETVYFEWVAPVCYFHSQTPVPSVRKKFDRDELWKNIQEHRAKNSRLGLFRNFVHQHFLCYFRNEYITKSRWFELKKHLDSCRQSDDRIFA